jgi:Flp pilus assembly pilin Flp
MKTEKIQSISAVGSVLVVGRSRGGCCANSFLVGRQGIGEAGAPEAYYEDHDPVFETAGRSPVRPLLNRLWTEDHGQDIAEYAVMLAVILVLVVGTIRLVGSNANNAFSAVASSIQ